MRSKNTLTLSVIIPSSQEGEWTAELCSQQLEGIKHQIIMANNWKVGLVAAEGEYVCFIEKDAVLGPDYFKTLLGVFHERMSFRKLAMVSPALAVNDWKKLVYGYRISPTSVLPSHIKSSTSTYHIQVGYVPGSLIRRSALGNLAPADKDPMADSVNLCLYFWNNGQRIALTPDAVYVSSDDSLDVPFHASHNKTQIGKTIEMFKQELIG